MSVDEKTRVSEFKEIRRRLNSLDEPLRSWEWRHLLLRMDNSRLTIKGLEALGDVRDVAFSLDGSKIVSASDDHTIRVWDFRRKKSINNSCHQRFQLGDQCKKGCV